MTRETIFNPSKIQFVRDHFSVLLCGVLLAIGAALRIWQYAAGWSLWVDEIALARGIIEQPLVELLSRPLHFGQIAPRGFVLLEKLAVSVFGANDYALRLVPLLCGLGALAVFWRIAEIALDRIAAPVALALFAAAAPLIIYSAQVKQYSGDVFAALCLELLIFRSAAATWPYRRAAGIGAAGIFAALFSHPAVFVIPALASVFLLWDRPDRVEAQGAVVRPFVVVLVLWGAAETAGILAAMAGITSGGMAFMSNFWFRGFPPLSLTEAISSAWPWDPFKSLMGGGYGLVTLGYRYPAAALCLMVVGAVAVGRARPRCLALILAPIAVTLAAAIGRQYPFTDRLILFLIPNFLLLIAAGIGWMASQFARLWNPLRVVAALSLTGAALWPVVRQPPPYGFDDTRPVLSYLSTHRLAGDAVYIYYGAWQATQYYGPKYQIRETDYFAGDCYRGSPRRYLRELDLFRGRARVWILIAHALPRYRERDDIVAYLDAIGVRRGYFTAKSNSFRRRAPPAELLLFDLSDPERLRRAAAETFEIKGRTSPDPRLPCGIHERPVRPSIQPESRGRN